MWSRRYQPWKPNQPCSLKSGQAENELVQLAKKMPWRNWLSECPISVEKPVDDRFAHGVNDWTQRWMVARERQMLQAMNAYTDQPD